uniref:Uncharacterized protein n=1 Tax=Parascaris univalens TaxID=6257 RepID=A0A915C522_PARUN
MCRGQRTNFSGVKFRPPFFVRKNRTKVDPFEEGEMIDYEQKKPEEKGDKRTEGRGRKEGDEKDREKGKTESVKKAKKLDKVLSPDNTLREVEGGMPQMEVTHNTSHEPIFTDEQLM